MSEQTRGKLSNQKPKMKSLFVPRLITISLCWPFLLVAPINYRLYHGTAYWPFVKFDILFDQDNIIDLWSISCIFGFVPQHATAQKLSQLRTPQKTLSSDLDPPQIPSKICLKPLLSVSSLIPSQISEWLSAFSEHALRKLQNLLDLLRPEIGCAQPWSTLGMYAKAKRERELWFVNDGFTFARAASLSAAAAA